LIFFYFSVDDFDMFMLQIKKYLKKIILIYFLAKNIFEKHLTTQYEKRIRD